MLTRNTTPGLTRRDSKSVIMFYDNFIDGFYLQNTDVVTELNYRLAETHYEILAFACVVSGWPDGRHG